MPLFVCEKCGAIENTALGTYWARESFRFKDHPELDGKALCSECTPKYFEDGSPTGKGEWHGHFPKEYARDLPEDELKAYHLINRRNVSDGLQL